MKKAQKRKPVAPKPLDWADRLTVVESLQLFLAEVYVHLPLKRALYGFDILRALENLKQQLTALTDLEFHRQIIQLVNRLRDAHTQYVGPWTKEGVVASLPFLVEAYGSANDTTYIVSKIDKRAVKDPQFREGVTITHWNGIPFDRAVALHAEAETGGRPDSRRARALESLTSRALEYQLPPNEEWVNITYVPESGSRSRQVKFYWKGMEPLKAPGAAGKSLATRYARSINFGSELVRRAKKMRFNHEKWTAERKKRVGRSKPADAFADFITAKTVKTKRGAYGHLRIWSFDVDDDQAFIEAVSSALKGLPQRGLIIDIRDNPGGLIYAAERLLQLFTPNPVYPTKFALRATTTTSEMARAAANRDELGPWSDSLDSAQSTGEPYSSHLPITPFESCNDLGQRYGGPIVLVADANTYSSGDLFAAGVVDNAIGPLVCVGQATGAGGANVWAAEDLFSALRPIRPNLIRFPKSVDFTMSFRRAVRAASADGSLIEDVGVAGQPYDMTGTDVLNGNADLIEHCAALLAAQPVTEMSLNLKSGLAAVKSKGLDRLDFFIEGKPIAASKTISPKKSSISQRIKIRQGEMIEVQGFASGVLRQRRRIWA